MAKEDTPSNVFGGFEMLADEILGIPKKQEDFPEVDPDKLLDQLNKEEEEEDDDNEIKDKDLEDEEEEEEESTEDEKIEKSKKKVVTVDETDEDKEEVEEIESLEEYEAPLTKLFQQELYNELGWEVEEGEEKTTIKDLVEYMKSAVSESAKPKYASEELQHLDDFVRQGGNLADYFELVPAGTMDLSDVDLTSESVQKDIIREYLSSVRGYSDDRIKKAIKRHEDGGILEEEAEDALELLKEYKESEQQKLLERQENYAKEVKKQQQKFYSDVETSIKDLKDIRGIKISDRDKKELLDYIFKPESDGRTKYQRDYTSSVQHLIESAFFTKDKDKNTLLVKAKQSAKTDAYKEIHQKIKASKGKRQKSSGGQEESEVSDILGKLGHSLIRKV